MSSMTYGALDIRNCDCLEMMKTFPDGHFDLAIVDPPYGIGTDRMNLAEGTNIKGRKPQMQKFQNRIGSGAGKLKNRAIQKLSCSWDSKPPTPEYFAELRRVSKNQIIWGGNYFPLPPSRCVICWHKCQPWENFSAWEMAWTSFDMPSKHFSWDNALGNPGKIHPTQKPVELYDWLLRTFAKPGQRILDTHMGSGSIAIACHYFGAHLTACELDTDYYNAAMQRIDRETRQEAFC